MLPSSVDGKQGGGTLYQRVAEHVAGLIAGGTLRPGDRIPSVRKLSQQLSISVTTVLEAYRVLEAQGLVEARPQSGYYVRPPVSMPVPERTRSCTHASELDIGDLVVRILRQGERTDLITFGGATPHPDFLPTAQLNRILARVARHEPALSQSYDVVPGYAPLRVQIARRLLDAGCSATPEDVVTTVGAQEALTLCLRAVTQPGDTVALETPTYWGMFEILESLGLRSLEVATDPTTGICVDELSAVLERESIAAVVVAPSFGNPLGHTMPEPERRRLVELVTEHGIPLVEDDVYGELASEGARPKACKAFDSEGMVLLCSSFSKTLAPGYRIGWAIPGRFRLRLQRLKYAASVATATPVQMAVASYLEGGGFERHLRRLRRTYRDLVLRMAHAVGRHFPEGTRVTRPAGGHVLWVEMPERCDSMRLYEDALAAGISIIPGPLFTATDRYRSCLRLNCAVPWSERIEAAVETLGRLADREP